MKIDLIFFSHPLQDNIILIFALFSLSLRLHFAPKAATCLAETHVTERAGDHGRIEACSQRNLFVQNVESRCYVTKTWLCFSEQSVISLHSYVRSQ